MDINDKIRNTAISVIYDEYIAVKKLSNSIDDDFIQAVRLIYESNGRVIVTGIGKGAIIAQKIVATFNSTGTPSIFLHAADAIHGDLGIVTKEDIVIIVSKSGETPEIKVLIPLIKARKNKIIALVGNKKSFLANQADYILDATVEKEACPNNLAPTTSTTAQLVMGDALAISLLELKDFSAADFAKFHPGGSLGKRMFMRVIDLASNNEVPVVDADEPIPKVIIEISSKRLGATAVLEKGKLIGVVTDGDLRRMIEKHNNFNKLVARDVMTNNPLTIDQEELVVNALSLMRENNITQLPVTDNGNYIGVIHLHDILKEGIF
ncbi:MAG TPA: KpsF/GutQ family sugar-phosphate isomerase [Bacteroidales bacterium]|nr:D-arabinose 5-phosphate isomerase [Bacteroidota bacterium]HJN05512.1 KpsF/GutQ family sugar-phosphate isomerase [Bacteroidales bacterium]